MLNKSRLNVYIEGSSLSPRQRERLQAQVQSALSALPNWAFDLLSRRIDALGIRNLPLIVSPEQADQPQAVTFGQIDGRPAVRLKPRLRGDAIEWPQDRRYLVAKAVAYMAAPDRADTGFWTRWSKAIAEDDLAATAAGVDGRWSDGTHVDLLIEMFAAYALSGTHSRWESLSHVRKFFDEWR